MREESHTGEGKGGGEVHCGFVAVNGQTTRDDGGSNGEWVDQLGAGKVTADNRRHLI